MKIVEEKKGSPIFHKRQTNSNMFFVEKKGSPTFHKVCQLFEITVPFQNFKIGHHFYITQIHFFNYI